MTRSSAILLCAAALLRPAFASAQSVRRVAVPAVPLFSLAPISAAAAPASPLLPAPALSIPAAASGGRASDEKPRLRAERPLDLRPTQMAVGMRHVAGKVAKLLGMSKEKADDWLKERPVPVVLGPAGAAYMIDRHHLVRAAWEAGVSRVHVEVKADWSDLSEEKFWARMKKEKWVYPYDQFGKGPHDVADLPEDVRGLADDPYRSVAGAVREEGGYRKTDKPFAEFLWAQYFRKRLSLRPVGRDFKKALAQALTLARDEAARRLPGWAGR